MSCILRFTKEQIHQGLHDDVRFTFVHISCSYQVMQSEVATENPFLVVFFSITVKHHPYGQYNISITAAFCTTAFSHFRRTSQYFFHDQHPHICQDMPASHSRNISLPICKCSIQNAQWNLKVGSPHQKFTWFFWSVCNNLTPYGRSLWTTFDGSLHACI